MGINMDTLSIVDDLYIFFNYPWGEVGYIRLLSGFKGDWARNFARLRERRRRKLVI